MVRGNFSFIIFCLSALRLTISGNTATLVMLKKKHTHTHTQRATIATIDVSSALVAVYIQSRKYWVLHILKICGHYTTSFSVSYVILAEMTIHLISVEVSIVCVAI